MKYFIKVLLVSLMSLYAQAESIDIYVLNPEEDRGDEGLIEILKESNKHNNESIIIDSRNGEVVFRGDNSEVKDEVKKVYGGNKLVANDIPYTLRSIYQLALPKSYKEINLYLINSIFYKDKKYDFKDGIPNDAFLFSTDASFIHVKSFENLPIKTYISNSKKMFMHSEHREGLKRFYTILCDRLKLNLQTFNTTFSTKKEKIIVDKLNNKTKVDALAILTRPPKKLNFNIDRVSASQNRDQIRITIENRDRANMSMYINMNETSFPVVCDKDGKCIFDSPLRLGTNTLTLNKLDGTKYERNFTSNYLPADDVECYLLTPENVFVLKVAKSHRPENDIVKLQYIQEGKEYNTKVVNGFYEFKIPLVYADNEFALTHYTGNIHLCEAENTIIKEKEEKQRIEEERRIAEEKRKQEEIRLAKLKRLKEKARLKAIAKQKEKARQERIAKEKAEKLAEKALEDKKRKEAEKRKATAINKGVNRVTYDKEVLITNYDSPEVTKDTYAMDLNTPRNIDSFFIRECDGDNVGDDRNSFDIFIEDEYGNRKQIASTVHASGNNVCKDHVLDNPYKNFMAIRIVVDPIGALGPIGSKGGAWGIEKASITYAKGQI